MAGSNTQRRRRRLIITWLGSFLLSVLLVLVIQGQTFGLPLPAQLALRLGIVVALLALQFYYWRTLDEVARAVQMRAFFWSGLAAWGGLIVLVLLAPAFPSEAAIVSQMGALTGAMLMVGAHGFLFLILWSWAWMKPA